MIETLIEWLQEAWDVHSCLFHVKTSNNEEGMITLLFILETEERQNGIYCLKFLKKWNDLLGTHAYRTTRPIAHMFSTSTVTPLYRRHALTEQHARVLLMCLCFSLWSALMVFVGSCVSTRRSRESFWCSALNICWKACAYQHRPAS